MRFSHDIHAKLLRVGALLALASTLACADFSRGDYWDLDGGAEDSAGDAGGEDGEYGYIADVHPLLDAGCERCHGPGNSASNTSYLVSDDIAASYASALDFVDLDNPGASRLLSKTAGQGHGGGTIFDDRSAEYDLILAWIDQGAPP